MSFIINFFLNLKSDKLYIRVRYLKRVHRWCNLRHPKNFTEKLQWIKLNDRKEIYHKMVDKVEAKKFISERIGGEYVIPTIGVWESFDDIDFDSLPEQFIIKNTFDSGSYYICTDKSRLNIEEVRQKLLSAWDRDYYVHSREWPYKGLKKRIIAEPLLKDDKWGALKDYKIFTFNGEPKIYFTVSDRGMEGGFKQDFMDFEGNLMPFNQIGFHGSDRCPEPPRNLHKMVEFSRILAKDTYHLRVDFYEVNGKVYVGELTFFDAGGWFPFYPKKYERLLGDWIKLPTDK